MYFLRNTSIWNSTYPRKFNNSKNKYLQLNVYKDIEIIRLMFLNKYQTGFLFTIEHSSVRIDQLS